MEKIITKNQVIHTIGAKLGKEFSTNGFKYVKSQKHLKRKYKGGFDNIGFSTYNSYPISHQVLSVWSEKRIDIVENIVNKFYDERFMNTEFHKTTVTVYSDNELLKEVCSSGFKSEDSTNCEICTQIKNLEVDGVILHTENDIENVANFLIPFIRDKALPFFEVNNDLNYANRIQKEENLTPPNVLLPIIPVMHSLTLMKLTKDSDFNVLKDEYLKRLVNPYDDFGQNKLVIEATRELITYLESKEF